MDVGFGSVPKQTSPDFHHLTKCATPQKPWDHEPAFFPKEVYLDAACRRIAQNPLRGAPFSLARLRTSEITVLRNKLQKFFLLHRSDPSPDMAKLTAPSMPSAAQESRHSSAEDAGGVPDTCRRKRHHEVRGLGLRMTCGEILGLL